MRKPHRRLLPLLAAALLCSGVAHAELKGSYALDSGRQKLDLYYVDDQHMRANLDDENQIVMKGSDVWILKRQGTQWLAVHADQVGALLKAAKGKHQIPDLQPVTLKATERRETVAGFPGRIFEATSGDKSGDVTLSDNNQVLALTNGWRKLALKLSEYLGAAQSAQLQQVLNSLPTSGMGGLLRQGDQLALLGVDTKVKAADADFPADTRMVELPKLQLPDFN
jgi:hypothetical protein